MEGTVRGLQAVLTVPFRIDGKPDIGIEFVIDTGFAGELLLPEEAIKVLRLSYQTDIDTTLADGTERTIPVYAATITWDNELVEVGVLAAGKRPLLGTALLALHRVEIEFDEGGAVHVY